MEGNVKMMIKELQPGQGSVNIELTIKSLEDLKVINKFGKDLKLRNAIATDGEDEIKLTLWNDDTEKVKVGSIIKITNGYVNEFQGTMQLTTGKFGKLEVEGGETVSEEKPVEQTSEAVSNETPSGEDSEAPKEEAQEAPKEEAQDASSGENQEAPKEEVIDY